MKIGSFFTGTGGLDMATEAAFGAATAWVSDIDKGACKILAHRFPGVPNLGDITAIDWSQIEPVDIITGGSPCQDLSHAGRRAGMTDGTRSNLWVAMREGIAQLRPTYVIWENVRGAYSAAADSAVVPGGRLLVRADARGTHLRALGRVLGDLSDLGYDAQWRGLRAADVGACHSRFRVFVVARRDDAADVSGYRRNEGRAESARLVGRPDAAVGGHATDGLTLLGTPTARMWKGSGPVGSASHSWLLEHGNVEAQVLLLPTPAVNDMGKAYTPEEWDAWTERMKADHGNGNGNGKSLEIEAARLANGEEDADSTQARPGEVLSDVRGAHVPQEVQRPTRGPDAVPVSEELLQDLREQQGVCAGGHAPLASPSGDATDGVRGMRDGEEEVARSPQGSGRDEQRPIEPDGAVCELPPPPALAGGPRRANGVNFGQYEAAVQRWEAVLDREAPAPTEPTGKNGAHRLSARFTEFLMGLPSGWITDVPGITRNEALKACGNGVVPQQAYAAITHALDTFDLLDARTA